MKDRQQRKIFLRYSMRSLAYRRAMLQRRHILHRRSNLRMCISHTRIRMKRLLQELILPSNLIGFWRLLDQAEPEKLRSLILSPDSTTPPAEGYCSKDVISVIIIS